MYVLFNCCYQMTVSHSAIQVINNFHIILVINLQIFTFMLIYIVYIYSVDCSCRLYVVEMG